MFVTMGLVTIVLGLTGRMIPTPGSALIGTMQAQLARTLVRFFVNVEPVEAITTVASVLVILGIAFLLRRRLKNDASSMQAR
jgi:hypothetical protein